MKNTYWEEELDDYIKRNLTVEEAASLSALDYKLHEEDYLSFLDDVHNVLKMTCDNVTSVAYFEDTEALEMVSKLSGLYLDGATIYRLKDGSTKVLGWKCGEAGKDISDYLLSYYI